MEWHADILNFPARDSTPAVSSNRIRLPAILGCPKFIGLPRNVTKFHWDSWTGLDLVRFGWTSGDWTNYIQYFVVCCSFCAHNVIYVLRNVKCPKPINGRKYMYMLCFQKTLKSIIRLTFIVCDCTFENIFLKIIGKQNILYLTEKEKHFECFKFFFYYICYVDNQVLFLLLNFQFVHNLM